MTRRGAVEVGFVLLGFYAFLAAATTVPFLLFFTAKIWTLGWFLDALKGMVPGGLLVAFGWALVSWRQKLSARFFTEKDDVDGTSPRTDWREGAYHFGMAMLGVFTLARWAPRAFVTLMILLDSLRASSSRVFPEGPFERMSQAHWQGLFTSAATFAAGVYLLLGAPGLRQWLVKRARGDDEPPALKPAGEGDGQPDRTGGQ